jgi:MinD superfamily P-loop ATPase
MRELVIISGKGGAGKTSVTAAFAHLAASEPGGAMLCDLDVDAPDLHLLLAPDRAETHEFRSGHEAVIDPGAQACAASRPCAPDRAAIASTPFAARGAACARSSARRGP